MPITKQFIRFVFVGVGNTLIGFCLYAFFIALGLHYTVAAFFSTCLGVIINFFSTGKLVFPNNNGRILHFCLTSSFLYLLSICTITFYKSFGFDNYGAYLLSLPILALISFSLSKWFVFTAK